MVEVGVDLPREEGEVGEFPQVVVGELEFPQVGEVVGELLPQEEGAAGEELPQLGLWH